MSYAFVSKAVVVSVTFRKLNVKTTYLISTWRKHATTCNVILEINLEASHNYCFFFLITLVSTIPLGGKRLFHVQKWYSVILTTTMLVNNIILLWYNSFYENKSVIKINHRLVFVGLENKRLIIFVAQMNRSYKERYVIVWINTKVMWKS